MSGDHASNRPIRIVLVDDSEICRHQLKGILQAEGQIDVVAEGSRGEDALALLERYQPDMLLVDLVMPGQGGLETIALVMARHPLPILVLTGQPAGVRQVVVFEAIQHGALDLAEKPRRGDSDAEQRLCRSIGVLARVPVVRHIAGMQQRSSFTHTLNSSKSISDAANAGTSMIIGIGASAGGPAPLATLLGELPKDFSSPIAVVQHLPIGFMDSFAEYLRGRIALPVRKVTGREPLKAGVVYLPSDDRHLVVVGSGNIGISSAPPIGGHRPSVDVLFESLARIHGTSCVGVILSGIGQDGVRGLHAMRNQGALTLAQDEESCAVFGMPQAALKAGAARHMMTPEAIGNELQRYAATHSHWRNAR